MADDFQARVLRALFLEGLLDAGETPRFEPLAGGVSSDIFRVDLGNRVVCVKRALERLKVADEWHAPVGRNAAEVAWIRAAAEVIPGQVPELLVVGDGFFVMSYLDPQRYPNWKAQLLAGTIDPDFAAGVGGMLGRLHAWSAAEPGMAARFANDAWFDSLRLDPYFRAGARACPALAAPLLELVSQFTRYRRVLVHGDVSPKNVLAGPDGPVLLDAECACFGDPSFDVAFCVNHLMLKSLHTPARRDVLIGAADALLGAYRSHVDWEPWPALEERIVKMLAGLMLARVDGKSPVEYLDHEAQRSCVRDFVSAAFADRWDTWRTARVEWTRRVVA